MVLTLRFRVFLSRWNQTKMGLKDRLHRRGLCAHPRLKSDQNGIESLSILLCSNLNELLLKSDQNGIESIHNLLTTSLSCCVEIRPKWDWKCYLLVAFPQNGSCWNQTKMGLKEASLGKARILWSSLKSDQNGIESLTGFICEELRRQSWNQTKMGLKVLRICRYRNRCINVEIRPKWDWKRKRLVSYLLLGGVLKSDQNGIERKTIKTTSSRSRSWNQTKMGLKVCFWLLLPPHPVLLKSDQNGIERLPSSHCC